MWLRALCTSTGTVNKKLIINIFDYSVLRWIFLGQWRYICKIRTTIWIYAFFVTYLEPNKFLTFKGLLVTLCTFSNLQTKIGRNCSEYQKHFKYNFQMQVHLYSWSVKIDCPYRVIIIITNNSHQAVLRNDSWLHTSLYSTGPSTPPVS